MSDDQMPLFGGDHLFGAHARRTDPDTSHAAAASISSDKIRLSQEAVRTVVRLIEPCCDLEIADYYRRMASARKWPPQSDSGLRTRRSELVEKGIVVDSGKRRRLPSGRQSILWRLA